MTAAESTTPTIDLDSTEQSLAEVADLVGGLGRRVVLERGGVPVAVLVSPREFARLERMWEVWEEDERLLEEVGAAFADQDPETIERETARAIQEVREEARYRARSR